MRLEYDDHKRILRNLPVFPIIANDFDLQTSEGVDSFYRTVTIDHDGEYTDSTPHCSCGQLTGGRNYGTTCSDCGTMVMDDYDRPFDSRVWVRAPRCTPGFVHPAIWDNLHQFFGTEVFMHLIDPDRPVPAHVKKMASIKELGIQRGYNYFVTHVRDIVRAFKGRQQAEREQAEAFIRYLDKYDDIFFQEHLPFPTPNLFVLEITEQGRFRQESREAGTKALVDLVKAERGARSEVLSETAIRRAEQRVAIGLTDLTNFYRRFWKDEMAQKPGIWRQNIYGTLLHFTARGVIASLPEPQHYLECRLPWAIALQLYEVELTGYLMRGFDGHPPMSILEIRRRLDRAASAYDPLIYAIFRDLIDNSYFELLDPEAALRGERKVYKRALPFILQRNPSLMRASAQLLGITDINRDPEQNTVDTNTMILVGFNADYDGDALNIYKINDRVTYEKLRRLRPEFSVMDLNVPNQISANVGLPAPVIATISAWFHEEDVMVKKYLETHPGIKLS